MTTIKEMKEGSIEGEAQMPRSALHGLHNVESRIVRVLELTWQTLEELSNAAGPRKELVNTHCGEFMKLIKEVQVTLREEIKSACEYRSFEKCDYSSRLSNELSLQKLHHAISHFEDFHIYQNAPP